MSVSGNITDYFYDQHFNSNLKIFDYGELEKSKLALK